MNKMNATIGSAALTAAFVLMPFAASAATLNASSTTGVIISPNGIVRVIGADVTSIGSGFINAATTLGNTVLNWIVNISATTNVSGNGTANASTTGITVGDKIAFKGALTGMSSSTLTVTASRVRDITKSLFPFKHVLGGKVSSVNSAGGSFVITKGDRSVTVLTNASTTITFNGSATTTLASVQAGDEVKVSGTPNADGSVVTATNIVVREHDEDDDRDDNRGDNNRGKDKDRDVNARAEARANANASFKDGHEGKGKGLNLFGGLGFGLGKDD